MGIRSLVLSGLLVAGTALTLAACTSGTGATPPVPVSPAGAPAAGPAGGAVGAAPAATQGPAGAPPAGPVSLAAAPLRARIFPGPATPVCGPAGVGDARCHSFRRTDIGWVDAGTAPDKRPTPRPSSTPTPAPTSTPPSVSCPNAAIAGYQPCDLQSAYQLPSSTAGAGQTVAIVDAYDDPNAEQDLAVYRSTFGIPACTSANGCFRKVNELGGTSYPRPNNSWAQEISLDFDMVSAVCPNCHILLVEANSSRLSDLATAVGEAATLGANAISNSYGGSESAMIVATYGPAYNNAAAGRAVTASNGDSGYSAGPQFPADLSSLTATGGTSLLKAGTARGWSETVWSGTGSGCSTAVAQPSWQGALGLPAGCAMRIIGDVAADADPNTGVAVYDSFHASGWLVFGGTSVSSPITASVYALAGNAATVNAASYVYAHDSSTSLNDVTSGSNGSCSVAYLCTGEVGYDGPTGLGTPLGTAAY